MQFQCWADDQFPFSGQPFNGRCGNGFPPTAGTYITPCRQQRRARPSAESAHSHPLSWFMPMRVLHFGLSDDDGDDSHCPGQPSERARASTRHHQCASAAHAEPSRTCKRSPAFPFQFVPKGGAGADADYRRSCPTSRQKMSAPCQAPSSSCGGSPSSAPSSSRHSPVDDAVLNRIAKDLFGYLISDEGNTSESDSDTCSPSEQRSKDVSSDNASPCTAERKCEGMGTSDEIVKPPKDVASCSKTDGDHQKPDEEVQTTMTEQSKDPQREASSSDPRWTRALSLPGFSPSEIDVKVSDNKVHVKARREVLSGPSLCLSRMEMRQVVALPDNVDQRTLACSMKPDGTLLFTASLTAKLGLEDKAENLQALEHKDEKKNKAKKDMPTAGDEELGKPELEQEERTEEKEYSVEVPKQENADNEDMLATKHQVLDQEKQENAEEEKCGELPEHNKSLTSSPTIENQEMSNEQEDDEQADEDEEKEEEHSAEENPDQKIKSSGELRMEGGDKCSSEVLSTSTGDFQIVSDADCLSADALNPETKNDEWTDAENSQEDTMPSKDVLAVPSGDMTTQNIPEDSATNSNPVGADATPPIKHSDEELITEESAEHSNDASPSSKDIKATPVEFSTDTDMVQDMNNSQSDDQAAFRLSIPLAGFTPENNIHVQLRGSTVTVTAQRQAWIQDSPYTEGIQRQVELPAHLDTSTVRCLYQDATGDLVITARPKGD